MGISLSKLSSWLQDHCFCFKQQDTPNPSSPSEFESPKIERRFRYPNYYRGTTHYSRTSRTSRTNDTVQTKVTRGRNHPYPYETNYEEDDEDEDHVYRYNSWKPRYSPKAMAKSPGSSVWFASQTSSVCLKHGSYKKTSIEEDRCLDLLLDSPPDYLYRVKRRASNPVPLAQPESSFKTRRQRQSVPLYGVVQATIHETDIDEGSPRTKRKVVINKDFN